MVVKKNNRPYVFDENERAKVNEILKHFVGTHNFHNYSTKVDADTPQARRFIISFSCSMPFKIQGEDFVKFEILGQSFLFNMIRKLVGMTIAVSRGYCGVSDLLFALRTKQRVNTPMAPELGLFLCECQYDAYNKRFSHEREPLLLEKWAADVEAFKQKIVYKHIYEREFVHRENMAEWIHKFISDKKSFREQYDVAMHRAMLKDESLQPLSIKNSKKQRTNAASTKSSDSAAARKNTHNNNNNNNEKKDEHREEASLIEAAKEAAARVAKKRLEEQETQRLKKIQAQKKIEDDFKNGIAPAQDYIDDEMSE